jgi:hypothetical protein
MFAYQPTPPEGRLHNLLDLAQKVCAVRALKPEYMLDDALEGAEKVLAAQITAVSAEIGKPSAAPESAPVAPRPFRVGDRVRVVRLTCKDGGIRQLRVGESGVIRAHDPEGRTAAQRCQQHGWLAR